MPIYDYHCDHCGHAFSAIQRFADDALTACPSCGEPPRRLRSNPALVFKGSGWYKTDSRGPDKSEKKDRAESGKDATGTDGKLKTDKDKDKDKDKKDQKRPSDAPTPAKTAGPASDAAPAAPTVPPKAPGKAPPASS